MSIWVLTEEYNDYDQHGAYFVHAWNHKPTIDELQAHGVEASRPHCPNYPAFVLTGGGRICKGSYYENQWYLLKELE